MSRCRYRNPGRRIILNVIVGLVLVGIYFLFRGTYSSPATDIHVVDGDTIKCMRKGEETTVRLLGIDCPESRMTDPVP